MTRVVILTLGIAFWVSLLSGQWILALLCASVSELIERVFSHV